MNNTKSILLVAIITTTLVLGTSVIPMQSYADRDNNDDHKKGKDFKSSISASSDSSKKSASQHQDQDNFCYRGDDCEQANQGQQVIGKDNDAKGFNDQSDNIEISTAGAGAGNGTGNGTGTGNGNGGTPRAECELCLADVDLTNFFGDTAVVALGITNTAQLCALLDAGTLPPLILGFLLEFLNLVTEQCLIDAGISLTVRPT